MKTKRKTKTPRSLDPLVRPGRKEHYFTLKVTTYSSQKQAELAVLTAFATRRPDNCDFHFQVRPLGQKELKDAWMSGARAGAETAFDALAKSFEKLKAAFRPNGRDQRPGQEARELKP